MVSKRAILILVIISLVFAPSPLLALLSPSSREVLNTTRSVGRSPWYIPCSLSTQGSLFKCQATSPTLNFAYLSPGDSVHVFWTGGMLTQPTNKPLMLACAAGATTIWFGWDKNTHCKMLNKYGLEERHDAMCEKNIVSPRGKAPTKQQRVYLIAHV